MSEFITLYQRKQSIKAQMRKIQHTKDSKEKYEELKQAADTISKRLDEIIAHEQHILNLNKS